MLLKELHAKPVNFVWEHEEPEPGVTYRSPERLMEGLRPHVCVDLRQHHGILKEATYKEIASLIDPAFLQQAVRAAELTGIRLDTQPRDWSDGRPTPFEPEDTLNFLIHSSEHDDNNVDYLNLVKFDDWEEVGSDQDLKNAKEKALMLLWVGNIRLHCTCPSYLLWGYQYLCTAIDAAIYPEIRKPVKNNSGTTKYGPPADRGVVCKHLNRILKVLPFYNGAIAREIKAQFGS